MTTKQRGDAAEDAALAHLQAAGLVLVARNYRTPGRGGGEIDLIVRDPRDGTLVFVEVRQRASTTHGGAGGSITAAKKRRIVFAARHYLSRLRTLPPCRFDVVLVEERITWIRAAFDAGLSRRGNRCAAPYSSASSALQCSAYVLFQNPQLSSRPMLEQRIQQHFIDSADLKYQAARYSASRSHRRCRRCWPA